MRYLVRLDSKEKTVVIKETNGYYDIEIDGRALRVDCEYFGTAGYMSLLIDNKSYLVESAPVRVDTGQYYATVMGRHYDVEVLDELSVAARAAEATTEHSGRHTVLSPMPGLILEVRVEVGDVIEPGASVVRMEAMKMQNELTTPVGGVVKEVLVRAQDTVDSQVPLVVVNQE